MFDRINLAPKICQGPMDIGEQARAISPASVEDRFRSIEDLAAGSLHVVLFLDY